MFCAVTLDYFLEELSLGHALSVLTQSDIEQVLLVVVQTRLGLLGHLDVTLVDDKRV